MREFWFQDCCGLGISMLVTCSRRLISWPRCRQGTLETYAGFNISSNATPVADTYTSHGEQVHSGSQSGQ